MKNIYSPIEEGLVGVSKSKLKAALLEAILLKMQELVEPRNKDGTIELSMLLPIALPQPKANTGWEGS